MLPNTLLLRLIGLFQVVKSDYTTTLNSQEQRIMAIEEDLGVINVMLSDIDANYASYTSYMASNNMVFPEALVQFVIDYDAIVDNTAERTSFFINSLPLTECYTFYNGFPWYTSLLSEAGAATFYLPDAFSTVVLEDSVTLDLSSFNLDEVTGASASIASSTDIDYDSATTTIALFSATENSTTLTFSSKTSKTSSSAVSTANAAIALKIPGVLLILFSGLLI